MYTLSDQPKFLSYLAGEPGAGSTFPVSQFHVLSMTTQAFPLESSDERFLLVDCSVFGGSVENTPASSTLGHNGRGQIRKGSLILAVDHSATPKVMLLSLLGLS